MEEAKSLTLPPTDKVFVLYINTIMLQNTAQAQHKTAITKYVVLTSHFIIYRPSYNIYQ